MKYNALAITCVFAWCICCYADPLDHSRTVFLKGADDAKCFGISRDGKSFYCINKGNIELRNIASGAIDKAAKLKPTDDPISQADLSLNKEYVVGIGSGTLYVWNSDLSSELASHKFDGEQTIRCVRFLPENDVCLVNNIGKFTILNIKKNKITHEFNSNITQVNCIVSIEDGSQIVVSSLGGDLSIVDIRHQKKKSTTIKDDRAVVLSISENQKSIFAGSSMGDILIYDFDNLACTATIRRNDSTSIRGMVPVRKNNLAVVASVYTLISKNSTVLELWDVKNKTIVQKTMPECSICISLIRDNNSLFLSGYPATLSQYFLPKK